MEDRERLQQLRASVATGDGETLVSLLQRPWPEHALQLIGDGLLGAVSRRVAGARDAAAVCVAALGERDWDGDQELMSALAGRLGTEPAPLLKALPVDLELLADVLEGDPISGGGRIDLSNGEVWPESVLDTSVDVDEDENDEDDEPERWLWVPNEGSRAGYRDMERFTATIEDAEIADLLWRALDGRGAFRRFKDQLRQWPDLQITWHAYSTDRQRGRARALARDGRLHTQPTEATPTSYPDLTVLNGRPCQRHVSALSVASHLELATRAAGCAPRRQNLHQIWR